MLYSSIIDVYNYYRLVLMNNMPYKTTIVIENETRNLLKEVGKKQQTYDQLIRELLELKKGKMKLE